jgi:hypothetical protein
MNDDDLRSSLSRRASLSLSADERNDVIRAARVEAAQPRRQSLAPRLVGALLGLAAVLVLAIIALPIFLSPPPAAPPSNSLVANASAVPVASSPVSTPDERTPSPSVSSALPIVSAQGLADLIGNPTWVGRTVLADLPAGAIIHDPCAPSDGSVYNKCNHGSLMDSHGPYGSVVFGSRDATSADGVQQDDGNGYHWVTPLAWPTDAGTYAFKVDQRDVEYLGPARLADDGQPFDVSHFAGAKSDPTDDVYVVNGWLGHTLEAPCAFPQEGLVSPMPDISSYYCGGSWLADHQWSAPTSGLTVDGGMHVQNDAYDTFAPNPQSGGTGGESRQGTYLVRNAGCPEVVTGDCPVWRMVGRLDGVSSPTEPAPTPAGSGTPVHVSNETTLTLTVSINGNVAATSAPQTQSDVDPSAYQQPWHATVSTSSGRQLIDFSYSASDVVYIDNSARGVAQRVDLSCGQLDVYAGPALAGPPPPSSFAPGDCDEAPQTPVEPPPPPAVTTP